jgi:hypothetical protein
MFLPHARALAGEPLLPPKKHFILVLVGTEAGTRPFARSGCKRQTETNLQILDPRLILRSSHGKQWPQVRCQNPPTSSRFFFLLLLLLLAFRPGLYCHFCFDRRRRFFFSTTTTRPIHVHPPHRARTCIRSSDTRTSRAKNGY